MKIKYKDISEVVEIKSLTIDSINANLESRNKDFKPAAETALLESTILNDSTAYLGINSFNNSEIKEKTKNKTLKRFLKNSFKSISENKIQNVVIDVSKNGGGTEGNEGLLYSYIGEDYKKYLKVRAKTQKAILDNGVDKPITLKTLNF